MAANMFARGQPNNGRCPPAPDGRRAYSAKVVKQVSISCYRFTAMAEISIFAPPIKPATCTVARAGFGFGMSFL
jgi:hypothetical protein